MKDDIDRLIEKLAKATEGIRAGSAVIVEEERGYQKRMERAGGRRLEGEPCPKCGRDELACEDGMVRCMDCDYVQDAFCRACPGRHLCERNAPFSKNRCCFGDWDERTGCGSEFSKCAVRDICELATKAGDGIVAVTEELGRDNPRDAVAVPEGDG